MSYRRQTAQPAGNASVTSERSLLLLPFELLLKCLETTALRKFEATRKITLETARKFDNTYMTHVDKYKESLAEFIKKIKG